MVPIVGSRFGVRDWLWWACLRDGAHLTEAIPLPGGCAVRPAGNQGDVPWTTSTVHPPGEPRGEQLSIATDIAAP